MGLATFFPGGIVAGNVLAGTPTAAQPRYDLASGGRPNIYPTVAAFQAGFLNYAGRDFCQAAGAFTGKGADCSRLPFHLRAIVPPG